jgi:hypothetical protein
VVLILLCMWTGLAEEKEQSGLEHHAGILGENVLHVGMQSPGLRNKRLAARLKGPCLVLVIE